MNETQIQHLYAVVESQYALDLNSDHGRGHWNNVWRNGRLIGKKNGADLTIIRLFSFLHDSKRQQEYSG
jgi:HD superfamily phosphodiesterase